MIPPIRRHKDVGTIPSTLDVLLIINLPLSLYINKKKSLSCATPETDARNHTARKIISVISLLHTATGGRYGRPTHVRPARNVDRTRTARYKWLCVLYNIIGYNTSICV